MGCGNSNRSQSNTDGKRIFPTGNLESINSKYEIQELIAEALNGKIYRVIRKSDGQELMLSITNTDLILER
jgi:hypothetical protein